MSARRIASYGLRPALRLAWCAAFCVASAWQWRHGQDGPMEFAYIGPGAGFAFLGSFLAIILSVLASLLSVLIWPFRVIWLAIRRRGRFG